MASEKFLAGAKDPDSLITAIDSSIKFPEILEVMREKYAADIEYFSGLIAVSSSSGELLERIRSREIPAQQRMSLLKMFRRCVAPVLDTEKTKKISSVSTESLVSNYGDTFKSIEMLNSQFASLSEDEKAALAVLIGEYDTRGYQGYALTGMFFDWFEASFQGNLTIEGPRGAGRDVELSSVFSDFKGSYPCDLVIKEAASQKVLAVGFARYDSTRGGAQSDDRTGGNANKVSKAAEYSLATGNRFKLIFLADGPGLTHKDTWAEACNLDGDWDGRVRVTTLKTASERITLEWLAGD